MADCVDAMVDRMEVPPFQSTANRPRPDAKGEQLSSGHYAVLPVSQICDHAIRVLASLLPKVN